jgi:hypothetical protein
MQITIGSKVAYTDSRTSRKGTVIEVNEQTHRARIKWDDNRPRTWIAIRFLTVIS